MEGLSVVKRRFRKRSEILELLSEQLQSDLNVRSFCAERSIPEGSFHNWKRRYGMKQSLANNSAFAHVQVEAAVGLFAEVKGIKLYQPVSAGYLKELLS
jgi:hypothetical protein